MVHLVSRSISNGMDNTPLYDIAQKLLRPGTGILAADESTGTMNKRLASIDAKETPELRERFREILFTTEGIEAYLSGVILYDSTIRHQMSDGTMLKDVLIEKGIVPGIKVDLSTRPLEFFAGEVVTAGLDGLPDRLAEYAQMGAQFTKWRAVIEIGDEMPTQAAVRANAFLLARYAAMAQAAGMVPIIEPEVLFQGDHSIEDAERVTTDTLNTVFDMLEEYRVDLEAVILKSSMVLAGDTHPQQSTPQEVAEATLRTFHNSVPEHVPGIVFLSGGQTPVRATENLQAVSAAHDGPWAITFSYSRALEEPVLAAWQAEEGNVDAAQAALLKRVQLNAAAQKGEYTPDMEKAK